MLDIYACALLANRRPKEARDFAWEALDRAKAAGMKVAIVDEMHRHVERIEAAAE